ncbi:substrate-binding domain-containing protein [Antarcticibacterium sp. 1MA-6-2]|uniref:substrate-binding domain-containing protein n=1 Tax=Antarcticibacterium sp. 1MA-6-2 TaxID=2908210 RepID=UPI001F165FFC|nr:substrate-binding domain-containing protein [Antarcticibacterium sp. 1MA-6-2]UJH92996.1 substrate-binding domain-containing protein [Antarcticibacterium sp. 1MA-6-2]
MNGVQDVLVPKGYRLLISQSNESPEEEQRLIEALSQVRVDGIIISPSITTSDYKHLQNLKSTGMPLIVFDRDCPDFEGDKVLVDDYDGAFQAVEYLIKTGCKRIAHIVGPTGVSISKSRLRGYLDALRQYNLPIIHDLIVTSKGFTSECGEEVVIRLLDLKDPPDAIFVVNDQVAIGAMLVIRNRGFVIPDDISVIGFDDEPYCAYSYPSLSSVWQPIYGMGMLSAKILLNHCEENLNLNLNRREIFKPELMLRDSTKKC